MGKAAIIYWSGTGNTQAMAESIKQGMGDADLIEVSQAAGINLADYDKIAFGCPSMGDEVLEECDFDPYFTSAEGQLSGKKIALFGSYGWGDGQWMRDWVDRCASLGVTLFDDGLMMNGYPDTDGCVEYGKKFAAF